MRKQHDQRKDEIAAAALAILAEEGPRQLTARNLGVRVGMDGSSLFRHFESKGHILHAALDLFEAALSDTFPDAEPSWSSLRVFFTRRLSLVRERPEIIRLAFNQHLLVVAGESAHADRVRKMVDRSMAFIRACLEDAQAEGLIAADVPAAVQVWVVTGVLRGAALGAIESPPCSASAAEHALASAPSLPMPPRKQPTAEEAWQWLSSTLRAREQTS
jgi:AcrR family transcriptional regulator